jgi:hypothetical protein
MQSIVLRLLGGLVFVFLIGFGFNTVSHIPHHAYVFVIEGEYFAPPYTMDHGVNIPHEVELYASSHNLELKRYGEVFRDYKPNRACTNGGFFMQENRSLSGSFLEKLGLLSPFESRWNSNGTWNY